MTARRGRLRTCSLSDTMSGLVKAFVAVCLCLAGVAATNGCYCSCCNWVWCDDCQTGCCSGTRCSTPNCRPQPTPTPPPTPSWPMVGVGCCPAGCQGYLDFMDKVPGGQPGCEAKCASLGATWMNRWINDDSYCACYGACDCSSGDSQGNCRRFHSPSQPALSQETAHLDGTGKITMNISVNVVI